MLTGKMLDKKRDTDGLSSHHTPIAYTTPTPYPYLTMQAPAKKKSLDAIKRIEGLTKKLHALIEKDAYCPDILELALALQGQLKFIQGTVLESHLRTCAGSKLASKNKETFIQELLTVIGLSKR